MAANHRDLARRSLQAALRIDPHFPDSVNARAALEQIAKEIH